MLEQLEPKSVFAYFEAISQIPRGSGNCGAIADFIEAFGVSHGLSVTRDAWDNVILRAPASPGMENAPAVMLQGHTDMVCEKVHGSAHDFLRNPLPLRTDGEWVWSEGTTLGADDGVAVAMILAILADETAVHPALECVFTTDEEIGLVGAQQLDLSGCRAKYLINLDCDVDGMLIAGCCGGACMQYRIPLAKETRSGAGKRLVIDGLAGGHSGAEIHKNGGNAVRLMARLLSDAMGSAPGEFAVVSIEGGNKDNVIPSRCEAVVLGTGAFDAAFAKLYAEYKDREPSLGLTVEDVPLADAAVLTSASGAGLLRFLREAPCGVQYMHDKVEGLVDTSANLADVHFDGEAAWGTVSVRSTTTEGKNGVCHRIAALLSEVGGTWERSGDYPGWAYAENSVLRELMADTWEDLFGEKAKVEVIHAGLECGVLLEKMPELDIISYGPEILSIHSPAERLNIASTEKNYRFLLEVLKRLGTHAA